MPPFPTRLPRRCLLLLALALLAAPAGAQEKPLLSAEIRSAFADGGAAAARARFRALFPDQADQYQVDPEALGELGLERMQQGDTEGMQAVMEMVTLIGQSMAAEMMGSMPQQAVGSTIPATPQSTVAVRADQPKPSATGAGVAPDVRDIMGEPRSDLERFVGQYGDPDDTRDPPRNLFSAVRCDGYLVIGATFGDAALWHMRSASETRFEMDDPFFDRTIVVEFELGPDGGPTGLKHNVDELASPLAHVGALPDGWGDECIPPPMR